ncbi:5-formyltetrahydrofolate cyclo-ligase [Deinococcus rubellus]|uniref:5-formyltetrahydrofolate cyclo-ligase n=2 Tax=Deinococcus rubellus TaxID=1889240 RepID=A0ABY5YKM5_9DEIO|nr:5-formyltetrahydrofolate cyclo-ligase [Deinococcus rubellus]
MTASKAEWRTWARAQRAELPDVSAQLCAQLQTFLQARGAAVVLAYRALPGEVDVSALSADFTLLAPRAHFRPTPRLTLHAWESATELSRFGALEPPLGTPEVGREAVDAVLLPGLAFDTAGVRLGYGGGFYDRLLADWLVCTVGVVANALLMPALPREAHDLPVQWLASETGVRRSQQA